MDFESEYKLNSFITMKPVGETTLHVCNPKNGNAHAVKFIVVKNSFNCSLSLSSVQHLNLIFVNDGNLLLML